MNDFRDPFQEPYEDLPEFLGCCCAFIVMLLKVWLKILLIGGCIYMLFTNFSLGIFAIVILTTSWLTIWTCEESK